MLFNLGSLPLIWLGYFRGWRFVCNFSFRIAHLLLIAFISAENMLGAICPLTTWEDQLRVKAGLNPRYEGGYVAHWLHRMMFFDFDPKVFAIGYGIFLALVLITFFVVKPRTPRWWRRTA